MKITFLGHSSFLVESADGTRIITDPYAAGPEFTVSDIDESADIVTVSHQHPDHNNVAAVKGDPELVSSQATSKGIEFKAVESYHDSSSGEERGSNVIFVFAVDGLTLCHLGDLGHVLDASQVDQIGRVDVLFIPVGGGFTIDAQGAHEVCRSLGPKVVIPMHYKTAGLPFLEDVSSFLEAAGNVDETGSSTLELSPGDLPDQMSVVVLKPSLSEL